MKIKNKSILWESHLYRGHDYCMIQSIKGAWEIAGTALLLIDRLPSRLNYTVHCDSRWRTSFALIEGFVGNTNINIRVEVTDSHDWHINGEVQPNLRGCLDIDLGFTPATNSLPIQRLALEVGASSKITAAWLKIPDFCFSPLDQEYSRTSELDYLYQSRDGAYSTALVVNKSGFVTKYPKLWTQQGVT